MDIPPNTPDGWTSIRTSYYNELLEQRDTKSEYALLVESAKIIKNAMRELDKEEGTYISPAWVMLHHAEQHITKLAEKEFREESKWQPQN